MFNSIAPLPPDGARLVGNVVAVTSQPGRASTANAGTLNTPQTHTNPTVSRTHRNSLMTGPPALWLAFRSTPAFLARKGPYLLRAVLSQPTRLFLDLSFLHAFNALASFSALTWAGVLYSDRGGTIGCWRKVPDTAERHTRRGREYRRSARNALTTRTRTHRR